jgi:hypothetical protein
MVRKEAEITEITSRLRVLMVEHEMAIAEFAAQRDLAQSYLNGVFPYSASVTWPDGNVRGSGAYRFANMGVAEAARAVLQEVGSALTAEEIREMAHKGRLFLPLRNLTAALRGMTQIEQLEDGRFKLKEEEEAEEPFD